MSSSALSNHTLYWKGITYHISKQLRVFQVFLSVLEKNRTILKHVIEGLLSLGLGDNLNIWGRASGRDEGKTSWREEDKHL